MKEKKEKEKEKRANRLKSYQHAENKFKFSGIQHPL